MISVKIAGGSITVEKAVSLFQANLKAEGCTERDLQQAVMDDVLSLTQAATIWDGQTELGFLSGSDFRIALLGKIVFIRQRVPIVRRRLALIETMGLIADYRSPGFNPVKMSSIPGALHEAICMIVGPAPGGKGSEKGYEGADHSTDPITLVHKKNPIIVREYYLTKNRVRSGDPYRFVSRSEYGKSSFYYSSSHVGNGYQYKLLLDNHGVPVFRDTSNQFGGNVLRVEISNAEKK